MIEIEKDFQFEAAHYFEHADANDLFKHKEVVAPLDHSMLNDIEGLSAPALEQIAMWIFDRLAPKLPGLASVEVGRPSCGERARIKRQTHKPIS